MNRYLKLAIFIISIILLIFLLSPVFSLFLPLKLTNHTYYRLLYWVIVDKETKNCLTAEERALKIFQYVVDHEFSQGTPYRCKPAESLIFGEAYCDFKARTLNALSGVARVPSRYAMLIARDEPGVSCHTLNEVFLNNKWCVFDPATNIIFKDNKGKYITLQEMSDNFDLIKEQKEVIALKNREIESYSNFISWFQRMFPLPALPRRSTPCMLQDHIFDKIADIWFEIFKYNFFTVYQDAYLKFKKRYDRESDFNLFFMARNYHLAYRYDLALECYRGLLEKYPQSKYREDAIFFCGMFYFDKNDFPRAIDLFRKIIDESSPKWRGASNYYLDKIHALKGEVNYLKEGA